MPDLGWQELVIVLVIVVIIFGAGKLPELSGAMGKSIKEFKKATTEDEPALPRQAENRDAAGTAGGSQGIRAEDI